MCFIFFVALTIVLYFICSTDRCIVVGTVEVATDFGGVERDPMCSRDGRRDRGVCEELATSALTQFLLLRPRHRQRAFRHYDLLPEVSQIAKSSNPQDRGCCRLPCVVCCRLKHLDVSMCRGVSRRMCAKLEDSMELLKSMNQRLIGDEADIIWKDKNSRLLSCRYSRHSIALFYSSFPIDILTLYYCLMNDHYERVHQDRKCSAFLIPCSEVIDFAIYLFSLCIEEFLDIKLKGFEYSIGIRKVNPIL